MRLTSNAAGRRLSESRMRENLTSGSMWQGMGNQDMAKVLRHSQKKWRATGLPCLRLWHHPLTLPLIAEPALMRTYPLPFRSCFSYQRWNANNIGGSLSVYSSFQIRFIAILVNVRRNHMIIESTPII